MSELQETQETEDIETKARSFASKAGSGSSEDVALAFDEFMRAFEAFKAANDERLAQIEQSISEDVVTTEKLDRINRAMDQHKALVDQLTLKAARPQLGGSAVRSSGALLQHKAAFEAYVRHGEANGLHLLEQKALSVGSGADGGYLVPPETEAAVIRGVKNISPIRAIAGNRTVSASVYKKPFAITGPATGWVAETATRMLGFVAFGIGFGLPLIGLSLIGAVRARQLAGLLARYHRPLMRVTGALLIFAALAEPLRLLLEGEPL